MFFMYVNCHILRVNLITTVVLAIHNEKFHELKVGSGTLSLIQYFLNIT